jgi:alpha-beta hydrolase superfamily lysophospholipase
MVEYRGYGDSDDVKPTEKGLKLDAEAAYNFLLNINSSISPPNNNIDPEQIFVFGRSLGGAVAFHLAKYAEQTLQRPLKGILVENTFTSISKMVDALMPAIAPFKFLVLTIDWNSEKIAPILHTPILYLAGEKDELVPHSQMKTLFKKSHMKSLYAKMHIIKNGTHNDSWIQGGREYYNAIQSFISHVILHGDALSLELRQQLQAGSLLSLDNSNMMNDDSRRSSLDVTTCTTSTSASTEVTMGVETSTTSTGAIPIMPKTIVGIAKEKATNMFTSDSNTNTSERKKKEI